VRLILLRHVAMISQIAVFRAFFFPFRAICWNAPMTRSFRLQALKFVAAVAMSLPLSASAGWDTGDMSLADWGIVVGNDNLTNYNGLTSTLFPTPLHQSSTTYNGFHFSYVIEDSDDNANHNIQIGPYYGGQDYDVEFLGMGISGGQLVIGILTGQRPDNGSEYYSPGDIRIATSAGVFGVEVGGGPGGMGGKVPLPTVLDDPGSTYHLVSGVGTTDGWPGASHTAGSVWKTDAADWSLDAINHTVPVQLIGGTQAGGTGKADSFMNTRDALMNPLNPKQKSQHAIIEVAISLSVFGGATIQGAAWAPSCNNDFLELTGLTLSTAPEPGSMALMGLGGLVSFVAGAYRRRRNVSAA
jgi:hypothetical protein